METAGSANQKGRVTSNGTISLLGSSVIHGDARPGTSSSIVYGGTSYVTGSTASLPAALSYSTPTLPGTYTDLGAISLSGVATQSISAGVYHATSLSMSNSSILNITGGVTLYVDGAVSVGGSAVVNVYQNRPGNFAMKVLGSSAVTISNGSNVQGNIYAPLSAVSITGAGGLSGGAIGKTLTIGNSSCIHYDESLGYGNAGEIIVKSLK